MARTMRAGVDHTRRARLRALTNRQTSHLSAWNMVITRNGTDTQRSAMPAGAAATPASAAPAGESGESRSFEPTCFERTQLCFVSTLIVGLKRGGAKTDETRI